MAASVVAEAWLIWGMIGRFKAFKVTLGLLVAITLAEETVGAAGMALVIALIGVFLVLLSLGRLATGGSMARGSLVAAKRVCISKTLFSSVVSVCISEGSEAPGPQGEAEGPTHIGLWSASHLASLQPTLSTKACPSSEQ